MGLIRFPQDRVDYDSPNMDWGMPATILIMPVVRVEHEDTPLMDPRAARKARAWFDLKRRLLDGPLIYLDES
ncbi:hypothetical protein [Bradyrhizobium sp.]